MHPEWQDGVADPGDWVSETLNLGNYVGSTVTFRFRFKSYSSTITGDGWYIDDLAIETPTGVEETRNNFIPQEFRLDQNYPNPFNPSTTLSYQLPVAGYVSLKVFNMLGEEIARLVEGEREEGSYSVTWTANDVPSGIYYARMRVSSSNAKQLYQQTRKLLLLK